MLRYHPKLAEVDPENPACWATCQRCGFVTNLNKMQWQWDFRGTPGLINTRILTCGRPTCVDVPNPQFSPIILPPDPEPVFNAQPENYALDEAGPDQTLAATLILNLSIDGVISVAEGTGLYLLVWGDELLLWGPHNLAWSISEQQLVWNELQLIWGSYDIFWG